MRRPTVGYNLFYFSWADNFVGGVRDCGQCFFVKEPRWEFQWRGQWSRRLWAIQSRVVPNRDHVLQFNDRVLVGRAQATRLSCNWVCGVIKCYERIAPCPHNLLRNSMNCGSDLWKSVEFPDEWMIYAGSVIMTTQFLNCREWATSVWNAWPMPYRFPLC